MSILSKYVKVHTFLSMKLEVRIQPFPEAGNWRESDQIRQLLRELFEQLLSHHSDEVVT